MKIKNFLVYFVVHAVILVAVIFTVIRIMLPHVKDNLPHLEKLASESFGVMIQVEKVDTGWRGLAPALRFQNVKMLNALSQEEIAQVHYFDLELDLFGSLRRWKITPGSLTLDGVTLSVEQQEDGSFRLKNHTLLSERPLGESLGELLNRFQRLEIKNGDFDLILHETQPVNFHLNHMRFFPHERNFRFETELTHPKTQGMLSLISDLKGELGNLNQSQIDGYLKLSQIHYDSALMPWKFFSIKPVSGQMDLDAWFKWEAGQWQELIGKFSLDQMLLQNIQHPELTLPFDFDAEIAWQNLDGKTWKMSGDNIHLRLGEQGSEQSSFVLEGSELEPWNFRMNTLALDDVLDFLALSDQIDSKAREAIRHLNPHGNLRELQWVGRPTDHGLEDWHLGLKLIDLNWQAHEKIPGLKHLSGEIKLSEHQGQFLLDSQPLEIDLPKLYESALVFESLQGLISWKRDPNWVIQSQDLILVNHELALSGDLSLTIPQNNQPAIIDLSIESNEFNQNILKKYLPTRAMSPTLLEWIQASLDKGQVKALKALVKGPRIFELRFILDKVDLRRHMSFPGAKGLKGELVLDGNFDGKAIVSQGSVVFDQWNLALDQVKGELGFTKNSVTAQAISGEFLGRPGVLSASTVINNGISTISWNFHSVLDKALIQHFAKSDFWHYIDGTAEYDAKFQVTIPKTESPFSLTLLSTLEGISLDLPKPIKKTAEEKVPSSVTLIFPDAQTLDVRFDYGQQALGSLMFQKMDKAFGLKNAQFVAGNNATTLPPPTSGIQLTGRAQALSVQDWTGFFDSHEKKYPRQTDQAPQVFYIDKLLVDDLEYSDYHLSQANISVRRKPDLWSIDLESQEIKGKIALPHRWGAEPLLLNLTHCTWPLRKSPSALVSPKLSPKDIRPIDLQCDEFNYKKSDIGSIHIGVVPHAETQSVNFNPILLESPIDTFSATGTWAIQNGQQISKFAGKTVSVNMGNSLRSWGVPTDVQDAKGEVDFSFNWPGSPAEIALKNLSGELDVRMQNGRFIGVNPGFGRMLGLLSFQGLQRRLRLDFSDVYKEGFAFDTFKSNISIKSGNAYTQNAALKAPAADIDFTGRTGLVARDLDFDILVQAHLDSTIPAAAVAIANPAAGAAVWIVDKVFNPLSSISRYRYHVTGTWETPVFNDLTKEYRQELEGPAKVEEAQ